MESCSCARFVTQKLPQRIYIHSVKMSLLPKFKTFTSIVGFVQYCPKQMLTMETILKPHKNEEGLTNRQQEIMSS